jgi:uncharacterized protein DUF4339
MSSDQGYYLWRGDKAAGPYSLDQLKEWLESGDVDHDEQVQRVGSEEWLPLHEALSGRPVSADTRACPHCGGEIKTAAKICKHCKQSVSIEALPTSATPKRQLTKEETQIQNLLVSRGLVTTNQIQETVSTGIPQGESLLVLLRDCGLLTGSQVENVQAVLKSQVLDEAKTIGATAVERMLLTQKQLDQVLMRSARSVIDGPRTRSAKHSWTLQPQFPKQLNKRFGQTGGGTIDPPVSQLILRYDTFRRGNFVAQDQSCQE